MYTVLSLFHKYISVTQICNHQITIE
uniref:Uncharacterized protein n=1 Tax=Rhizophora mucronata TaxID=61149 RepID=A0A2P2R047_RHIMU